MKNKKEVDILRNEVIDIKHCVNEQANREALPLELSITKCPITCNSCKIIYSNVPTGFRIICRCNCHFAAENIGGNIKC